MFNTLGSFSVVYFALAAVLFFLVLFEKHFIQLEEKIKSKKTKVKKSARQTNCKKSVQKCNMKTAGRTERNATVRRIPNNAA
ncbi:MAG: hypothetical protein IJN88_10135 [Clostridia bacterium]|nr:hypothetical protein [Clostridia bacterium]